LQDVEAGLVARLVRRRCFGVAPISRRSSGRALEVHVDDERVDAGRVQARGVREMRRD
jgi:hypothetical protein